MRKLLLLLIILPTVVFAAPQDAEQFTHIAGVNLADLPSFDELQRLFGKSHIAESGDAGNYNAWICYRTSDGKAVVEFFHGEVHWGFQLRTPYTKDNKCPMSKKLELQNLSVAGISLGMNEAKYKRIMGKPNEKTTNSLVHNYEYVHKRDDDKWDIGIRIMATFKKGLLTSFTVNRVETN